MIISHDLGTTGDKATLVDAKGRMVTATTARYNTDFGHGARRSKIQPHGGLRSARPRGTCSAPCRALPGRSRAFPSPAR
jgi:hypothetical protein